MAYQNQNQAQKPKVPFNPDSLSSYIEVKDRLPEFFAKYPEGSLTGSYELVTMNGNAAVIYTAKAYRSPTDPCPAVGTAYEAIPGATKFTRGSEIQNAETAAWGRAMIATGAVSAQHGIASADEIRARKEYESAPPTAELEKWTSKVEDCKGDYNKLLALYKEAEASKAVKAILEMIKAAGSAAAAANKAAGGA